MNIVDKIRPMLKNPNNITDDGNGKIYVFTFDRELISFNESDITIFRADDNGNYQVNA